MMLELARLTRNPDGMLTFSHPGVVVFCSAMARQVVGVSELPGRSSPSTLQDGKCDVGCRWRLCRWLSFPKAGGNP